MSEDMSRGRGEALDWPQLIKPECLHTFTRVAKYCCAGHVLRTAQGHLCGLNSQSTLALPIRGPLLLLTKRAGSCPKLTERDQGDGVSLGHLDSLIGLHMSKVPGFPGLPGTEVWPSPKAGAVSS